MIILRIVFGFLIVSLLIRTVVSAAETNQLSDGGALVYVGTYTGAKSKGIYVYQFKTQNIPNIPQHLLLAPLGLAAETPNPSFLEIDVKRRLLFCVNEIDEFEGKPTGAVSAFSIDPTTGKLTLLNQRPSAGTGPCHLLLDGAGKNLLVANYGSGSVAVLPVGTDGRLGAATSVVQHTGKSINPDRQEGPHAHGLTLDAANHFAFACDLGLDQVRVYRFDAAQGTLIAHDPPAVSLKPGAGPRHLVFRPDGRFAYVINELNSTITVFAYDAAAGRLEERQTISTLPEYFNGANTTAEIAVTPSGKFLFASNRGHNSVVLFNVDSANGTLTYVEDLATAGKKPRHFGIDASGKYLVAANQDSDSLLVCQIDKDSSRLKPSGAMAEAPSPVCVKFFPGR
jgi:6-phosphogluconolactonase